MPTMLYSAKLWALLQSKDQQDREGTGLTLRKNWIDTYKTRLKGNWPVLEGGTKDGKDWH